MDSTTSIEQLKAEIRRFSDQRDWEQFHTPKNLAMAVAAEAGELLEPFLWMEGNASREVVHDHEKRPEVMAELADVIIFCLRFADIAGIDVADAIREKLVVNAARYPVSKARGSSKK